MTTMRIKQIGLLCCILLLSSACKLSSNRLAMTPADMSAPPKVGPIEYRLGWEHGCQSGLGAFGTDIQRIVYKFTMDMDFAQNKTYMRAWRDSFRYCRSFMNREMRDGYFYGEGGKKSDARVKSPTTTGNSPALWRGLDTPGWGGLGWGSQAKGSDWLGRSSKDSKDWLGRTPDYQ